jgi:hypothetical protein
MTSKKVIISVIATFLVGGIVSVFLQYSYVKHEMEKRARDDITDNPFHDEFRKVGAVYGLNMEFTRKAGCMVGSQLELEKLPLLVKGPRSCDILLVGDSSMAWGLIPEVVEQMTGLVMGTFTSEALILNVTTAKMIRNIASYYLKDDGLLILSFGGWTQEQDANSMVLVYSNWIYSAAGLDEKGFKKFIEEWRSYQLGSRRSILQQIAFSEYRKIIAEMKKSLGKNCNLNLLQLPLYAEYIEPLVNPSWYRHKKEMKAMIRCYLRWNNRSVVMYMPGKGHEKKSKHSDSKPDPEYRNKDIAAVSEILNRIPCRKAYQIHINFDDAKYAKLRSIYNAYYRGSFGLIDLGIEHPKNESYEVDEKEHTVNTGSFYQSILIGKALKRDYASLGRKKETTR